MIIKQKDNSIFIKLNKKIARIFVESLVQDFQSLLDEEHRRIVFKNQDIVQQFLWSDDLFEYEFTLNYINQYLKDFVLRDLKSLGWSKVEEDDAFGEYLNFLKELDKKMVRL